MLNHIQQNLPTPIKVKNLISLSNGFPKAQYLVEGFTYGFKLGVQGDIQTRTLHNHTSVLDAPDVVNKHLRTEMDLGHISGTHSSPPFDPFVTSHQVWSLKKRLASSD